MKTISTLLTLLSFASTALGQALVNPKPSENLYILWGDLTRPHSLKLVKSELEIPVPAYPNTVKTVDIDFVNLVELNPFHVTKDPPHVGDFYVGDYLPGPGEKKGPIPAIKDKDAAWFDTLVEKKQLPKVFIIGGHQVISEGWHNDSETQFMFLPTLLKTLATHPNAKKVFASVKLAVLFGCNTMTNLEPHGADGHNLSPDEIKKLYFSGPAGKRQVLGAFNENPATFDSRKTPYDPKTVNTLEFYKGRLAYEYGPLFKSKIKSEDHYEYTRDPREEKCDGPGKYEHCAITNLDRILPDSGLWDGTHRYNYPYMMRQIFPNANIILGFSSASPSEELRVQILNATFNDAKMTVKNLLQKDDRTGGKFLNNILLPLVEEGFPDDLKKEIIAALRKAWTAETYARNRHRASGSISPLFPELENGTVLGVPELSFGSLQYGPYEPIEDAAPDAFMEAGDLNVQLP